MRSDKRAAGYGGEQVTRSRSLADSSAVAFTLGAMSPWISYA